MSFKQVSQLTSDVLKRIGLVSGAGVQTYTEPQVTMAIQDAFDFLFRKRFWEHLSDWHTFALDGTLGVVTTNLTSILAEANDIRDIRMTESERLIVKPVKGEHLRVQNTEPLYYTALKYGDANFTSKVIKFWPPTATGSVTAYIRTHPGLFGTSDVVPFPQDIIGWAAAWLVLETDGLNPGNANKARTMFDTSYQDYVQGFAEDYIGHGGVPNNDYVRLR